MRHRPNLSADQLNPRKGRESHSTGGSPEEGATASALAREFNTSRNTIMRVRDAMPVPDVALRYEAAKKSGLGAICRRHMQEAVQTPKSLCNCSSGVSNHKHAPSKGSFSLGKSQLGRVNCYPYATVIFKMLPSLIDRLFAMCV